MDLLLASVLRGSAVAGTNHMSRLIAVVVLTSRFQGIYRLLTLILDGDAVRPEYFLIFAELAVFWFLSGSLTVAAKLFFMCDSRSIPNLNGAHEPDG